MPSETKRREFTRLEGAAFLIASIGVQLASELFSQWGTYFYSPPPGGGRTVYVAIELVVIIFVIGQVFDLVTNPLVGIWSDRTDPRPGRGRLVPIAGRRRPFIFWGSILITFTGVAFWHPPVAGASTLNLVHGTVLLSLHWTFFALAYIPLLALAPEVARSEPERVRLGAWIAVGMTLGLALAALLPGLLIQMLDPARGTTMRSPLGYQRVALLFALVALACFQTLVWTVRERFHDEGAEEEEATTPPLNEIRRALADPTFRLYLVVFFFFYIGLLAVQRAAPYWVQLGLGGSEETLSDLGVPFIVACLGSVFGCPPLTRRLGVKWTTVLALAVITAGLPTQYFIGVWAGPGDTKLWLARALYATQGFGLGLMYVLVTPLLGRIIDANQARYGARREGVFNSLHAMMVKAAQVLSVGVATQMMAWFGNSTDRPWGVFLVGPAGAAFCLIGLVAALVYPNDPWPEPSRLAGPEVDVTAGENDAGPAPRE